MKAGVETETKVVKKPQNKPNVLFTINLRCSYPKTLSLIEAYFNTKHFFDVIRITSTLPYLKISSSLILTSMKKRYDVRKRGSYFDDMVIVSPDFQSVTCVLISVLTQDVVTLNEGLWFDEALQF